MLVSQTTLDDLEWNALRAAFASFAQSPLGKARAGALGFFSSKDAVVAELDRVGEALRLLELDLRPSLHDLFDITQELGAARRGAAVPGIGLLNIAVICRSVSETRSWARALPDSMQLTKGLCAGLTDCRPLLQSLERSLDHNGEILDDASPALKQLRGRALQLHDTMTQELERMLVKLDDQGFLSDRFVSLRNDRFVIPVKSSAQHDVPGIVHDASHSGFTVFIEPEAIIERGNKLKLLRVSIIEEEQRILQGLSEEVAAVADPLRRAQEALTTLDVLFAKAAFARRIGGERPSVDDDHNPLDLERVRHPLLMLSKEDVVPNDIRFAQRERCLVLTGPNTGGKTAALKTVGIISLMAAAGLYIPARQGSRVPLYRGIYSVIGDNQSLSRALSTFSSHVHEVRGLIDAIRREHKDGEALVLLDELAADTDPRLGAALGQAILEGLVALGAWVVVTTHYFDLAALPAQDARFSNASFGFDPTRLVPTYRLQRGTPGASSPFEIAQNLGLDPAIISRAREIAPSMGRGLEQLTKQVEARLEEVNSLKSELEREKKETDKLRAQAAEERRLAQLELKAAEERAVAMLGEDVKRAQQLVKEAVRRLQEGLLSRPKERELTTREAMGMVEDVRRELGEAAHIVSARTPAAEAPGIAPAGIRPGDMVSAASFPKDAVGEVLAIDHAKMEATVSLGKLRMRLPLQDLVPADKKRPAPPGGVRPKKDPVTFAPQRGEPAPTGVALQGTRLDVRGARVEDALREIERALDTAIKESLPELVVVHGHGSGALKNAIREYLSFSHYVKSYRPGRESEGDDGVTVVEL